MDGTGHILFLLSQGEIASSFLRYLPAGELITLARTNSAIRADLHDFGEPHPHTATSRDIRPELQIGHHDTTRWMRLKSNAPFECSSSTHTKGTDVKPCRYCSRLICGACMTRASFANPGEKTFQNRCRSLCESCWRRGNPHQRRKLTDDCECRHHAQTNKLKGKQERSDETKTCECTNKNDGWVCLECKNLQNKVWSNQQCFGQGCSNPLDGAAEKRKVCMWCDKPLHITATRENPHVYKQKVVNAMAQEAASRLAEIKAHSLRRQKQLRMALRELRAEDGVLGNIPHLARRLDSVNYLLLLGYIRSTISSHVYDSKIKELQYTRSFLLSFSSRYDSGNVPAQKTTRSDHPPTPERTNHEVYPQLNESLRAETQQRHAQEQQLSAATWRQITRMRHLDRRSVREIQDAIYKAHDLWESNDDYRRRLAKWKEDPEAETLRAGVASPAPRLSLDGDVPRYWQDVGSAAGEAEENVNGLPRERNDARGLWQDRMPSSLSPRRVLSALRGANTIDLIAPTNTNSNTAHHHTADKSTQSQPNLSTSAPSTSALNHDISDFLNCVILSDLLARSLTLALALEETHFEDPEALEQIFAERAALQLEGDETFLAQGDKSGDDHTSLQGRVGEERGKGEGGGWMGKAITGEGGGEGEEEHEEDTINLLNALHKSPTKHQAIETENKNKTKPEAKKETETKTETETETERNGRHNENDNVNMNMNMTDDMEQNENEHSDSSSSSSSNSLVDAHSYENWNVSRADGRPPVYFA